MLLVDLIHVLVCFPGVNVTCENQSVVAGQNHNLTCRVDYSDADQNNTGCKTVRYFWRHDSKPTIGKCDCTKDCKTTITTTGCKTEQHFWNHNSSTENINCTIDCNTTITTKTFVFEIKNVTEADEGNYTFTINTNCGNGHGTLNVSVTCEYNVNIQ
jgi:1,4-alpha-glucan branching enzyme